MALPVYRDINYYRGDTFAEKLYPKNSDGSSFSLSGYESYLYIDLNRDGILNDSSKSIQASVDTSENSIVYTITSTVGISLLAETTYSYEVKIKNTVSSEVYTLVTGSLIVSGNVKSL